MTFLRIELTTAVMVKSLAGLPLLPCGNSEMYIELTWLTHFVGSENKSFLK